MDLANDTVATTTRRPTNWWLVVVAALFIIVPFLTWYTTWFGRALSDEKIAEYLADEKNPRHIQHALTQIESRMEKSDQSVKKFYPAIVALTKSPTQEVRKTAAWVMGQDNASEDFHRAIISLLSDSDPLVRRNAALQLVRFGDAAGRPELRAMLQSFAATSPIAGTLVSLLPHGSRIRSGSLIARIRDASGNVQEFRAPVSGTILAASDGNQSGLLTSNQTVAVKEGDQVVANQTIVWLSPDSVTITEALRALSYVGTQEDLPLIQQSAQAGGSAETAEQAAATVKAIEARGQ
jgi:biotin carboxyl carrier protein